MSDMHARARRTDRSGSAFLYSKPGRDNWIGGRGYAATASGETPPPCARDFFRDFPADFPSALSPPNSDFFQIPSSLA